MISCYIQEVLQMSGTVSTQMVSQCKLQVHCFATPCGICGGESGIGMGLPPSTSVFSCQYHSTSAPCFTWLAPMPHDWNNSQHHSVVDSTDQFSNVMISWNEQCENVTSCLLCVSTGV